MKPLFNVTAAFVFGAAVTCVIGGTLTRRRALHPTSDAQLQEHIRLCLPDLVSHPEAIEVRVESGVVRLSGRVLAWEVDSLLMRLLDVPGVYRVRNALCALDDWNVVTAGDSDSA